MDKKYLIIGASGMLGYRLALKLSQDPQKKVLGSWRSFEIPTKNFSTVCMDLSKEGCGDVIREFRPDIVFHLASETDLNLCERNPERVYRPINVGLFSLIDACNQVGSKLIFISSDGIFGRDEGEHYEDTLPTPVNVYGRAKVLSEGLIRIMCRNWLIVRCCPVGYDLLREKGLVCWVEKQVQQNRPMTGWTDSSFSPLTLSTLTDKLIETEGLDNRIIHLHSTPGITKYDFLCRMAEILGAPTDMIKPGKMGILETPRPKSQVLCSRGISGIEASVPIDDEFAVLKAEVLAR